MSEKGTLNFTNKISVLLVEHERGSLIYTTRLLEACSYKVVAVEDASTALWILSERKQEFDFVLADIHLPDLDPFTLLLLTSNMGLRTILMSAERDDMVLRRGLENGAYMVLEKPFFVETMKYLWQHVTREKISNEASKDSDESAESEESKGKSPQDDIENKIRMRKKMARDRRKGKNKEGFDQSDSNSRVTKRTCTEWTEELHQKFVDVVLTLGEGRCYPKNILEMMKVPGLTRMQVASHLQKCRNRKWRPPQPNPPRYVETPSNPRKFGSMPITPKERTCPGQSNRQDNKQDDEPPSGQQPGFDLNTIERRPIHPQPYLVPPPGFGINPLATNSSAPNRTQLTFSSVPTREARVSNVVNQNEMSNLNIVQQGYIPSRQKQLSENFFEFLPKKYEAIKHSYDPPEGLMSNQSSRSQRRSLDFNIAFSELRVVLRVTAFYGIKWTNPRQMKVWRTNEDGGTSY